HAPGIETPLASLRIYTSASRLVLFPPGFSPQRHRGRPMQCNTADEERRSAARLAAPINWTDCCVTDSKGGPTLELRRKPGLRIGAIRRDCNNNCIELRHDLPVP